MVLQLKENPFITKGAISELFAKRIRKYLDSDFIYYCTCEEYYPPVVEDYGSNIVDDMPYWCEKNGFKLVSVEGNGYGSGYKPKYRDDWY